MTYATIMVHVDPERDSTARIRLACGLAARLDATLIGAAALGVAPIVAWPGVEVAHQAGAQGHQELHELLARAEAQFRAAAQGLRKPSEWRAETGMPTSFLMRESRAADLLVVGQHEISQDVHRRLDIGLLTLGAGRPVLVVPDGVSSLAATNVAIAWKDTREARRAVQEALPLLQRAERVMIVAFGEDAARASASDSFEALGAYLARHGVTEPECFPLPFGYEPKEMMIDLAQGADLIVAGAYGRSRLNEWIFGGFTTTLLNQSPVCCLLSH